jgi:hypothetical protein
VAVWRTLQSVAWAIEGDGDLAMFMEVSAGAAASGAACTSVGDRSMRNYLKFMLAYTILGDQKQNLTALRANDLSDAVL